MFSWLCVTVEFSVVAVLQLVQQESVFPSQLSTVSSRTAPSLLPFLLITIELNLAGVFLPDVPVGHCFLLLKS